MNEKKMMMKMKKMTMKMTMKMKKMMIFYLSIDSTISNSFLTIPKKKKKSACWRSWAMRRKGRARARDAWESLPLVFLKKRRADGSKGRGGWNQR